MIKKKNAYMQQNYWFLVLFILIIGCSKEKEFTKKGYEKEQKGSYAEAFYDYQRALQENPNYGPANKRMGFLLSESQLSVVPAIVYLEKALKEDPQDLEVVLKLVDLSLVISDISRVNKLFSEYSSNIPQESLLFLETVKACLETEPESSQKILQKLKTLDVPENVKFYYRSVVICYQKNGLSDLAEDFVKKYRR